MREVHCRFSQRFEAMFMQSAMRASNTSGDDARLCVGRAVGEEKPCPTWMENTHGIPDSELLACRHCRMRARTLAGDAYSSSTRSRGAKMAGRSSPQSRTCMGPFNG